MSYTQDPMPPIADEEAQTLASYVDDQLGKIMQSLVEQNEVELRPSTRAPLKPREGMIVYADGTHWDPGAGKGAYVYKGGGGWVLLG